MTVRELKKQLDLMPLDAVVLIPVGNDGLLKTPGRPYLGRASSAYGWFYWLVGSEPSPYTVPAVIME